MLDWGQKANLRVKNHLLSGPKLHSLLQFGNVVGLLSGNGFILAKNSMCALLYDETDTDGLDEIP